MKYTEIGKGTGITGSLGKPLGTIIRISGRLYEGEKSRADEDNILFTVSKVDNVNLPGTVTIPVKMFPWMHVAAPRKGEHVTFIGYETGGMTGIPEEAFSYMPCVATTDYSFSVYFQVIKRAEQQR